MPSRNQPSRKAIEEMEARVGHPGDLWEALREKVQDRAIAKFRDIEGDWLRLMWSIDAYRVQGIPPRGMGKASVQPRARLEAVYRSKGNWFATLLSLLLQNQTNQVIRPRTKVQGFSQHHQVDLAWPARLEDPLVCVETKVTGAPAYGTTPSRGALSDFSNRRKELKFAATDLKLERRQQETEIKHWGVWREQAPPKTYFLWAARLRTTGSNKHESISSLIAEAQLLVDTYMDGAGIVAWREKSGSDEYETVAVPPSAKVRDLDDVLYRIASEIKGQLDSRGKPPEPIRPTARVVDVAKLTQDNQHD